MPNPITERGNEVEAKLAQLREELGEVESKVAALLSEAEHALDLMSGDVHDSRTQDRDPELGIAIEGTYIQAIKDVAKLVQDKGNLRAQSLQIEGHEANLAATKQQLGALWDEMEAHRARARNLHA